MIISSHGPLARYVKMWVAHAPGMPGTFSPPPPVNDSDMHHGSCVTHVPWCMPRSLTSGFLWSRWRGKRSRNSRRMRNPQFYVSGKRPFPPQFKFEVSFRCNSIAVDHIASTFFTCTAAGSCATFCRYHFIRIWIRAKWNFHHIWIVMEKLFVRWATGMWLKLVANKQ